MTVLDDDVAAARRAVASLERCAATLTQQAGDSLDGRRLQADVGRLGADLDLLCGAAPVAPVAAPAAAREVIPDSSYTHDFWMDAEDEGLGCWRGH